jgi:hypothetical protein
MQQPTAAVRLQLHKKKKMRKKNNRKKLSATKSARMEESNGGILISALLESWSCYQASQAGQLSNSEHVKGSTVFLLTPCVRLSFCIISSGHNMILTRIYQVQIMLSHSTSPHIGPS